MLVLEPKKREPLKETKTATGHEAKDCIASLAGFGAHILYLLSMTGARRRAQLGEGGAFGSSGVFSTEKSKQTNAGPSERASGNCSGKRDRELIRFRPLVSGSLSDSSWPPNGPGDYVGCEEARSLGVSILFFTPEMERPTLESP